AMDPADWMSAARLAVEGLMARGFRMAYWILDDHPPVGKCDARMLNEILPRQLEQLGAVNIGLLGCGQRRGLDGRRVPGTGLVRNEAGYRWKFSLHPALWDLASLEELIEARLGQFSSGGRTPWDFERHRDEPDGPVPLRLLECTYRVEGWRLGPGSTRLAIALKECGLWFFDLWRFFLRVGCGAAAREAFDREGLWLYHWYLGPYPVFWSGAVRAGKPSPEFQTFLRVFGRRWMQSGWEAPPLS
ncbi:MAG: hypothetical protein N2322_01715, partial [Terrimicrobiaceae bacterium]|nr:hypothetical protein [Terrimicrobiaceae bacterium]